VDRDQVWQVIDAERLSLADLLDELSAPEWETPSLCAGWRVRGGGKRAWRERGRGRVRAGGKSGGVAASDAVAGRVERGAEGDGGGVEVAADVDLVRT
jgi:hypothetical protein